MNRDLVVCACKQVTLGTIIDAVKDGASSPDKVIKQTGAATICTGCKNKVKEITKNLVNEQKEGNL